MGGVCYMSIEIINSYWCKQGDHRVCSGYLTFFKGTPCRCLCHTGIPAFKNGTPRADHQAQEA